MTFLFLSDNILYNFILYVWIVGELRIIEVEFQDDSSIQLPERINENSIQTFYPKTVPVTDDQISYCKKISKENHRDMRHKDDSTDS